ncbi:hypothetical protein P0Y43_20425 [Pseudomonas entomophila]|uniref:hypothetical protein n=1 Tax=Pseudomonas entomophila TaxID=312306 RepID=UPI0023D8B301|nr:hypothetical protein [Pseudomonas entomophila]MDF0733062.1 hypothetical protein [Pseudomonas entomophila]
MQTLNRTLLQPWPCIAVLLALLSGCQTHLEPVSYSGDFQRQAQSGVLLPVECLKPAAKDQFDLGEDFVPLLPPGCANNLTLMRMVEQPADLAQGRVTGATMAAPVGRAAQVYIEGYDRAELRRRQDEQQARVDRQERQ